MVMVCCGAKTEVFGGSDSGGGFGGVDRFARVAGGLHIFKDASDSSATIRSASFSRPGGRRRRWFPLDF